MAAAAPGSQTSLVPIFIARLLKAIVPGLTELPQSCLDELRSLCDRVEKAIAESVGTIPGGNF